jgi:F1F0 ATPase subunit 2
MTKIPTLALDVAAGLVLGAMFYGGLWWTVHRIRTKAAGMWFVGSFAVRALVTVAGFYIVGSGTWQGAAACLVGFLVARIGVTLATRIDPEIRPAIAARSDTASSARSAR